MVHLETDSELLILFEQLEDEKSSVVSNLLFLYSMISDNDQNDYPALRETQRFVMTFPVETTCNVYQKLNEESLILDNQKANEVKALYSHCDIVNHDESDIDFLPKPTGNLEKDCKTYLDLIKEVIDNNSLNLLDLSFTEYLNLEQKRNLSTLSDTLLFRKDFLTFLKHTANVQM